MGARFNISDEEIIYNYNVKYGYNYTNIVSLLTHTFISYTQTIAANKLGITNEKYRELFIKHSIDKDKIAKKKDVLRGKNVSEGIRRQWNGFGKLELGSKKNKPKETKKLTAPNQHQSSILGFDFFCIRGQFHSYYENCVTRQEIKNPFCSECMQGLEIKIMLKGC